MPRNQDSHSLQESREGACYRFRGKLYSQFLSQCKSVPRQLPRISGGRALRQVRQVDVQAGFISFPDHGERGLLVGGGYAPWLKQLSSLLGPQQQPPIW